MSSPKKLWLKVPKKPRQVVVLLVGVIVLVASALVGTIPGPGGLIVFGLAIAILSSEFRWADRFGKWILRKINEFHTALHSHPVLEVLFWGLIAAWVGFVVIWFF